ncbi:MAG: hypothetical protein Q9190_003826, partial [Brigantiaea leucoxantha]
MGDLNINSKYRMLSGHEIPALGFGPATDTGYRNEGPSADAIKKSGIPRNEIFFTTKVPPGKLGYEQTKASINSSFVQSGLDYIDLYLIHAPYGGKEARNGSWKALVEAQQAGKIRSLGVSNYGVHHLNELEAYIKELEKENGPGKGGEISVGQWELHPWLARSDIVDWCKQRGVIPEAYCPIVRNQRSDEPVLQPLVKKYNKSSAQILIRWSLQKGFVPLPKSVTPSRIEENSKNDERKAPGHLMSCAFSDVATATALAHPPARIAQLTSFKLLPATILTMPPAASSYRPQTLRQAKRAYQKSSGPRLTEIERRRLARDVELQARADAIKAREERAKENKRKKAEKLERDRETRKKMGIPEPVQNHVGPSQLSLGDFVKAGMKRDREELEENKENIEPSAVKQEEKHITSQRHSFSPQAPATTRPNCASCTISLCQEQKTSPKRSSTSLSASSHRPHMISKPLARANPAQAPPSTCIQKDPQPARTIRKPLSVISPNISMPPPPRPPQHGNIRSPKLSKTPVDDWDCFLDTNTQIEREISDAASPKSSVVASPAQSSSAAKVLDDTEDFLASISTQDLDYSSSQSPRKDAESTQGSDFGEDIKAEDLEDLITQPAQPPPLPSPSLANTHVPTPIFAPIPPAPPPPTSKRPAQSSIRFDTSKPSRRLSHCEIETLSIHIWDQYSYLPNRRDVERLIEGCHLSGMWAVIPPFRVTRWARQMIELGRRGKTPCSAYDFDEATRELDKEEEEEKEEGRRKTQRGTKSKVWQKSEDLNNRRRTGWE